MMKSLWARYQEEQWGAETIEINKAFITFRMLPDAVYIVDIYVAPEARRQHIAWNLGVEVENRAKRLGKTRMIASVDIGLKGLAESLALQTSFGLVPFQTQGDKIWLSKELKNG